MPTPDLIRAVAVTAELCGRVFSPEAAAVFVDDLAGYPEEQVFVALRRCRKEVRGVLTVQDVVSRLDDGRPGPDEAWAMVPHNEADSVVWTEEIAQAAIVAQPLLEAGDKIGARQAFKEAYTRLVNKARDDRMPPRWFASLGHDPHGHERVVMAAVSAGRLTHTQARSYIPGLSAPAAARLLEEPEIQAAILRLTSEREDRNDEETSP